MARLIKVDDIKWQSTQNGGWERPYEYVTKQDIDRMPAVDAVEVVHSPWVLNDDGSGTCKHCYRITKDCWDYDNQMHYCPNCGARMDLEVE
jgi:hypothetical protein